MNQPRAAPSEGLFCSGFFFFRWGEFQGEKGLTSDELESHLCQAQLDSPSPLAFVSHVSSQVDAASRKPLRPHAHAHACTHARTEVRCSSPLTLGGGTHTPVCNRVGIIYCHVTSGHFIPRDPPQEWLSIFNLLKLSSY